MSLSVWHIHLCFFHGVKLKVIGVPCVNHSHKSTGVSATAYHISRILYDITIVGVYTYKFVYPYIYHTGLSITHALNGYMKAYTHITAGQLHPDMIHALRLG